MRKGFTIIELVFVIVILGILAIVAIVKLNATRDDAEISKTATNIVVLINDLTSYYTVKNEFLTTISKMSNVSNPVKAKDEICFTVLTPAASSKDIEVVIGNKGLCSKVWELPSLKEIKEKIEINSNKIIVGGQAVKY
ncbi:type II secretion system protein [Campylobacter sp. CCUG 57310]|uniref:type II secretion system protein n=1 Tax=Campylobacter sp. CCUG 57310 TaxID=2517362 RepID=UPI001564E55A|nr:prepilin-type N-terminal cleavage/methylation domain-containing protein [Campylobacter sp. CCUG 57310]QKF91957.1 type II secretion/transformation system, G protein [Campylobacter sp. CCUG 57310]